MSRVSDEARTLLLEYARATLIEYLERCRIPDPAVEVSGFEELRATFVTLRHRETGDLRGCRGETEASRPLVESVAQMAVASATNDPRFPQVTSAELDTLTIEISALTPMMPIAADAVRVGQHGLMIVKGHQAGLLLPQVAVSQGWGRTEFLEWVCRKAGLGESAWRQPEAELYGFEAEAWAEAQAPGTG